MLASGAQLERKLGAVPCCAVLLLPPLLLCRRLLLAPLLRLAHLGLRVTGEVQRSWLGRNQCGARVELSNKGVWLEMGHGSSTLPTAPAPHLQLLEPPLRLRLLLRFLPLLGRLLGLLGVGSKQGQYPAKLPRL